MLILAPDQPAIARRRRPIAIKPALEHRDALDELQDFYRRVFFEQMPITIRAFQERGSHQERGADVRAGYRRGRELFTQYKRWIGYDPGASASTRPKKIEHFAVAVAMNVAGADVTEIFAQGFGHTARAARGFPNRPLFDKFGADFPDQPFAQRPRGPRRRWKKIKTIVRLNARRHDGIGAVLCQVSVSANTPTYPAASYRFTTISSHICASST